MTDPHAVFGRALLVLVVCCAAYLASHAARGGIRNVVLQVREHYWSWRCER